MYRMTIDGKTLYDADFTDYIVEKPLLKLAANKLATLTFTIYPNNPMFARIQKIKSVIAVYRDREVISLVRPVKAKLNFRGGIDYTCEDCLARLNDIKRRPSYYSGTQAAYLAAMLTDFTDQYTATFHFDHLGDRVLRNGSRGSDVREMQSSLMRLGYNLGSYGADGIFGNVTERAVRDFEKAEGLTVNGVFDTGDDLAALLAHFTPEPIEITDIAFSAGATPHSGEDAVEFINDDYVGYWDLLQKNIVEEYGGYLIPRYTANTITLDYMDDEDLSTSEQSIVFGENLTDLFVDTDSAETFSVLIPLGKDVRATGIHEGQAKNTPLTIKDANGGLDYLESADGLTLYGRREATMRWNDISNAQKLKEKGLEYLNENAVKLKEKITLSAIDLRYANVNIEYLSFMDRVEVRSLLHSVIDYYPLSEMQLSLSQPTASKLTLGAETQTLTDRMAGNAKATDGMYSALSGRVFNLENPN